MNPHRSFTVHEPSQVGDARRHAAALAAEMQFDEVAAGRLAIVVNELGSNLARHARQGRLLMAPCTTPEGAGIELLSLDRGPGMADVLGCLRDGFSTSNTQGSGLGAAKRLARSFDVYSKLHEGTVVMARMAASSSSAGSKPTPRPRFSISGVCLPAPGETVSGDGYAAVQRDARAMVMVADGLGHGPLAAEASDAALEVFERFAFSAPSELLDHAHIKLKSTRGAAVSVVDVDAQSNTLSFGGAGNVTGRLLSGAADRTLLTQQGTVGLVYRKASSMNYPWPEHAVVVLHSDGIATRWNVKDATGLLQCDPAVIAGWIINLHTRGKDDATVVVIARNE